MTLNDFVDYSYSFYGDDGIYPLGFTKEQILFATKLYIATMEIDQEFCGDTVDRERVRDIIISAAKINGYTITEKA